MRVKLTTRISSNNEVVIKRLVFISPTRCRIAKPLNHPAMSNMKALCAAAIIAASLFTVPAIANGNQPATQQCAPLEQTSTGIEINAGASAHIYSQDSVGAVGVSIFAGADLGNQSPHKLGTFIKAVMNKYGVEAECFVDSTHGSNGTSIQFHIDGLSAKKDGSFGISESLNKEFLHGIIAQAKTVKQLINQKKRSNH